LLVRDYRLVYEVSENTVHVLRVIHGSKRLPASARSS